MGYKIKKMLTSVNKGRKGTNKVEYIVIHWVGATGQAVSNGRYFRTTYRGASAHYFVDKSTIVQVVADDTPAWHVGDGKRSGKGKDNGYHGKGATNSNSIGVELCLDTSSSSDIWRMTFHSETIVRAIWLVNKLQKKYNVPDGRVIRHYDVSGKLCPGNLKWNNWAGWDKLHAQLAGIVGKPATGGSKDDGKPSVNSKRHLVVFGDTLYGIAKKYGVSVKSLVDWNDLDNPDVIVPESYLFVAKPKEVVVKDSLDKVARDTLNGKYGNGVKRESNLRKAGYDPTDVQSRVNEILGVSSKPVSTPKPATKSIATLVAEVYAGKHGNGAEREKSLGSNYGAVMAVINGKSASTSKLSYKQLKLDGAWGKDTTIRLQQVLGTKDDGIISGQYSNAQTRNIHSVDFGKGGSAVVRAMQAKLGVKVDGYIGRNTIKALQKRLGTPQTGGVSSSGSTMVIALQKRLNNNKF